MSDSGGQEAVMSQLANRRSLSVPAFRSGYSKPGAACSDFALISFQRRCPTDSDTQSDMPSIAAILSTLAAGRRGAGLCGDHRLCNDGSW